jgi:hypothetical protein
MQSSEQNAGIPPARLPTIPPTTVPLPTTARQSRDAPRTQARGSIDAPPNRPADPPVTINGPQFAIEVAYMHFQAKREYKPFWPLFGFIVGSMDVVISIGIIVLGTLIATYSNSGHPGLIRGLAIASTILAGVGALLQGTVSLILHKITISCSL